MAVFAPGTLAPIMKTHHCKLTAIAAAVALGLGLTSRAAEPAETNSAIAALKKQQEELTLENGVADAQLRKELARLSAQKQRLDLENSLAQSRLQSEIATMQTDIDRLVKQTDLLNRRAALKDAERRARA